jgi:hypothetical protein
MRGFFIAALAGAKDEAAIVADFAAGRIARAEADRRLDADFDEATAMNAYRDLARRGVFVTPPQWQPHPGMA